MNISVIGGHKCSPKVYKTAKELGGLIAQQGWILVCGGSEGVMEAACRGAKEQGGITVGILPSFDGEDANSYIDVKIPTGFGYARNVLVVRASSIIVALEGEYGTLSEIAFALNEGKTVIGIGSWDLADIVKVNTPEEAVEYIKKLIKEKKGGVQ